MRGAVVAAWLGFGVLQQVPMPARAQAAASTEPAPPDTTLAARDAPKTLAKVVVTSRRREETLQDVPVAVTAFTAAALDTLDVRDMRDLDAQVPNLVLRSPPKSGSAMTARIRGIGQSETWWAFDPAVGVYLDDVFIARPQGAMLDVFDTERIEVLRGPQGTLYGKNTIGGAIRYVPKPLPSVVEGRVEAVVGAYAQRDLTAAIGGPLGGQASGLRARVAVARLQRDGFGRDLVRDEPVGDKDVTAMRFGLGAYAGDAFSLEFAVDTLRDDSNRFGLQLLAPLRGYQPLPGRYDTRDGIHDTTRFRMHGASATARWQPGGDWAAKLVVAKRESSSRSNIEQDATPLPISSIAERLEDDQNSQELQVNYDGGGRARGTIGLYRFHGYAGGILQSAFNNVTFGDIRGSTSTDSIAAYADWTVELSPRWALEAGVRWTQEDKRTVVFNRRYTDPLRQGPVVVFANFDKTVTFANLSPRITLDFNLSPQAMLYALWARGYKSGGHNMRADTLALPRSANPIKDERLDSVEAGAKLALADDRLFVTAAAFLYSYDDIQLSVATTYDSDGDGVHDRVFGDYWNAGDATVRGVELEYQWLPTARWQVSGHVAWLDGRYDRYIDRGVDTARSQAFTNSPRWSGAVNVEYRHPVGRGQLALRASYSHESETLKSIDTPLRQGAYGLLSAGVIWSPTQRLSLSLQGRNLQDTRYLIGGGSSFGALVGQYGPPRQWSLGLRYAF